MPPSCGGYPPRSATSRPPSPTRSALVLWRIRLPARRKGLGLRSRVDLATQVWTAAFIHACESFTDGGARQHGLLNILTDRFGVGAFARGGHRFTTFLQGDSPCAVALHHSWNTMRAELGLNNWDPAVELPKGPLSAPVAMAGEGLGTGLSNTQYATSWRRRGRNV